MLRRAGPQRLMDPIAGLIRSIHLIGAIVRFGGALAMNVVVLPVVLDVTTRRGARMAIGGSLGMAPTDR